MWQDAKWCPLVVPNDIHGDDSFDTKAHKLRQGMRGLLAIKINTIEVTLCSGNEAHVRATLRCAISGVVGSFRAYSQS